MNDDKIDDYHEPHDGILKRVDWSWGEGVYL